MTVITPSFIAAIAAGGALGSVMRFLTQHMMTIWFGLSFPWGTLLANSLGCFSIGLVSGYWLTHDYAISMELRGFIVMGFLGAFTTFSAFSLDTLVLFQNGEHIKAMLNVIASVAICLVAVYLGHILTSR